MRRDAEGAAEGTEIMTPDAPPAPLLPEPSGGRPRRRLLLKRAAVVTAVVAALLAVIGGVAVARMGARLDEARRLAEQRRWDEVEETLAPYFRLWPGDAEARLLVADAVVRSADGPGLSEEEAAARVGQALGHLDRIPDDSPRGPEARLRAARLLLAVMKRPVAAEAQVRRAIARDPDRLQAHLLLWQVLDVTRRSDWAEPTFREVIRLARPDERFAQLRRWYLSQFAPSVANLELDRLWGIVPPDGSPDGLTELARYEMFRAAEPESPVHVAAAARLLLRNNQFRQAAEQLDGFDEKAGFADPFFAATAARAAQAAGDAARLEEVMRRWPGPREGYEYCRWEGIRLEENAGDPAAAATLYRKALEEWPGPTDWQLMYRLANCLRRAGKTEEADRLKERSARVERLYLEDYQRSLRLSLNDGADPAAAERVAAFYEALGRSWEAGLWREHAVSLGQRREAAE